MFQEAREYGDELVVSVTREVNVEKVKGIGSLHKAKEKKQLLEQIKLIDKVLLGDEVDPYKNIKKIKPDVIALGYDQKFFVDKLADKITEFGLETQIVRLSPYQENRFKSNKIRKYIERLV